MEMDGNSGTAQLEPDLRTRDRKGHYYHMHSSSNTSGGGGGGGGGVFADSAHFWQRLSQENIGSTDLHLMPNQVHQTWMEVGFSQLKVHKLICSVTHLLLQRCEKKTPETT